MAVTKNKSVYVCQSCGYESVKWYGRCPDCGEWNSLVEEVRQQVAAPKTRAASAAPAVPRAAAQAARLSDISSDDSQRYKTGVGELDRVLGGGIVAGSVMLLSGDPGIGKSTLLLQICQYLCGGKCFGNSSKAVAGCCDDRFHSNDESYCVNFIGRQCYSDSRMYASFDRNCKERRDSSVYRWPCQQGRRDRRAKDA